MCNWLLAPLIDFICLFVLIISLWMPDQNLMSRYSEINVMIMSYPHLCSYLHSEWIEKWKRKGEKKEHLQWYKRRRSCSPSEMSTLQCPLWHTGSRRSSPDQHLPKKEQDNLATCPIILTAYRRNIALPYLQTMSLTAILYLEENPVRNECNCKPATVCF